MSCPEFPEDSATDERFPLSSEGVSKVCMFCCKENWSSGGDGGPVLIAPDAGLCSRKRPYQAAGSGMACRIYSHMPNLGIQEAREGVFFDSLMFP